ncbi:MAG: hypothetical protein V1797_07605 [Pseudomonadota bacterium]
MAFTKALYYPYIDVQNENWLKSAVLYWDQIQTIVPESLEKPYSNPTSLELFDSGFLVPLRVNSGMNEIDSLGYTAEEYLHTIESKQVIFSGAISDHSTIYLEKLPDRMREVLMFPDKLPYSVLHRMNGQAYGETITVEEGFANYYMSLLARELSISHGLCPLSDDDACHNLTSVVGRGANIPIDVPFGWHRRGRNRARDLKTISQGLISNLLVNNVGIHPETTIDELLKFKEKHINELGKFRSAIGDLASACENAEHPEALRQQANDSLVNSVKPALNDLEEALKDSGINYLLLPSLAIWFTSPITSGVLEKFIDMPSQWAVLATPFAQLIVSFILYDRSRKKELRENPFSYLLKYKKFAAMTHVRRTQGR